MAEFQSTGPTMIARGGVRPADDCQELTNGGIPFRRGPFAAGLIEKFKVNRGGTMRVAGCDLLPQSEQARKLAVGIGVELFVVMEVDDDVQVVRRRLVHGPIDTLGKRFVDGIRGIGLGMVRPADREPNRMEASLLDRPEVRGLERNAPVPFLRGFQRIAKVDAPAEPLVGGMNIRGRRDRGKWVGRCGLGAEQQAGGQQKKLHLRRFPEESVRSISIAQVAYHDEA